MIGARVTEQEEHICNRAGCQKVSRKTRWVGSNTRYSQRTVHWLRTNELGEGRRCGLAYIYTEWPCAKRYPGR